MPPSRRRRSPSPTRPSIGTSLRTTTRSRPTRSKARCSSSARRAARRVTSAHYSAVSPSRLPRSRSSVRASARTRRSISARTRSSPARRTVSCSASRRYGTSSSRLRTCTTAPLRHSTRSFTTTTTPSRRCETYDVSQLDPRFAGSIPRRRGDPHGDSQLGLPAAPSAVRPDGRRAESVGRVF